MDQHDSRFVAHAPRERSIDSAQSTVSPVTRFLKSPRIAKAAFGSLRKTVSTGFTNTRFPQFRATRVFQIRGPGRVQATPDGSVWIGTAEGLNRWENGRMTVYRGQRALGQTRTGEETVPNTGRPPKSQIADYWAVLDRWGSMTRGPDLGLQLAMVFLISKAVDLHGFQAFPAGTDSPSPEMDTATYGTSNRNGGRLLLVSQRYRSTDSMGSVRAKICTNHAP